VEDNLTSYTKPRNPDRATYIQHLARDIKVTASFRLLDQTALTWGSESEKDAALSLLEASLSEGTTLTKPQVCDPEDCEDCFFKLICMQWANDEDAMICKAYDILEQKRKEDREAERQKNLHKGQTWNAETLAKPEPKPRTEPLNLNLAALLIKGYTAELLDDKTIMTDEEKAAFDRIESERLKKKKKTSTGQTFTANDDWHLTEDQKRRKRLMGFY